MNMSKEKMICAPWQPFLGVITVWGGIKHLYLQPGHPGYLLNKLPVEIVVYMHVCATPSMFHLMYWLSELDMHDTRQNK